MTKDLLTGDDYKHFEVKVIDDSKMLSKHSIIKRVHELKNDIGKELYYDMNFIITLCDMIFDTGNSIIDIDDSFLLDLENLVSKCQENRS